MKLATTLAALALFSAAAATSTSVFAQNKEIPHALTAPKSSLMRDSTTPKSRSFSLQGRPDAVAKLMDPPPTSAPKTDK